MSWSSDVVTVLDAPVSVDPAFCWVPDHHLTYGPEVTDFSDMIGRPVDAEQSLVFDAMYAVDRRGVLVCFEFGLICARQNLKTYCFENAQLYDLFQMHEPLSVWTAHEFDTSEESFRSIDEVIEANASLSRRVLKVDRSPGKQQIHLKSGSRLKFKARRAASGRGLSGDRVTGDEAFALDTKQMGSLLPVMSARPNPQIRYGSSAGMDYSAFLRSVRDRGRRGGAESLGYIEFCAPEDSCVVESCDHNIGREGCALDDPEMWRLANPALDRRIQRRAVRAEREALALEPEEFARERLGWWSVPGVASMPYSPKAWADLAEPGSLPRPGVVPWFALDVSPLRRHAAIAGCATREDGLAHVDVHEYADTPASVAKIVDTAIALCDKHGAELVVLSDGAAASLIPDLEEAGVKVRKYSANDYAAACGLFADGITGKELHHIGKREELNDAIAVARKRERDGVWTLTRKGGDIAPLVACLLAYHAWAVDNNDYDVSSSIY